MSTPLRHPGRLRLAVAQLSLAALSGVWSCGNESGPAEDAPEEPGPAIISDPVSSTASTDASVGSAVRAPSVVYVSLVPGTYPGGLSATITNRRAASSLMVTLIEGGLDPVPIAANAGDTLAFVIDTGGVEPARFVQLVPQFTRVRIVRTEPTGGKRDVPLNLRIRVIVSEPIMSATVNEGTLGLERAGTPVDGQVTLSADGLEAGFQPAEPLLPATDYTIVIREGIRDTEGSQLDPFSADFTTALSETAPFGAIEITLTPTGTDIDGEYLATLDGVRPLSIYPTLSERPVYFSAVSVGAHVVTLAPPMNCSVEQGAVPITVRAGFISRAEFPVTCEPFLAAVRISAPTSGPVPGSTSFRVTHSFASYWDYGYAYTPFAHLGTLSPNGALIVPIRLSKGGDRYWHRFMLVDIPESCIVTGLNPSEDDALTFRDTLDVEFPVSCSTSGGD